MAEDPELHMRTGALLRRLATTLVVVLALAPLPARPVAGAVRGDGDGVPQQVAVVADDGAIEAREVSSAQLADLEAEGAGTVVTRGRTAQPQLAQSVPKVGAPSFWNLGHRGAGRVI